MPDFTKLLAMSKPFAGAAGGLAVFPVNTRDPSLQAGVTTHWLFDFVTPAGWASGEIPANGANVPVPGAVDISRPDKLALPVPLRKAVTVLDNTPPSTFTLASGRGGFHNPGGVFGGAHLRMADTSPNNVGHPPSESFKDFLASVWLKPNGGVTFGSYFGYGTNSSGADQTVFWGVGVDYGNVVKEFMTNTPLTGLIVADTWVNIAVSYRFDIPADKIFVRIFINGDPIGPEAEAVNFVAKPSQQSAWPNVSGYCGLGSNMRLPGADVTYARYRRDFTSIAGLEMNGVAIAAAAKAEWIANKSRIAGL